MGQARTSRGGAALHAAPLSEGQIAIVETVYRRFAQSAAESLATLARTPLSFRLATVERLTCRGLRARWGAEPAALGGVSLDPLPGAVLCAIDRQLAFLLIDRLLGGRGAPAVPERGLSEIEGTVLRRAITALLPDLQCAWAPVCAVAARLEYLERRADAATGLLAPDTRLVCATFAAGAGAGAAGGSLWLAAAEASLAAIGRRLRAREVPARAAARATGAAAVLTVELGTGGLGGDAGIALDEGVVIGMGRFAGEPVAIEADSRPVARGRVVALDDGYGIRVTEMLTAGRLNGETVRLRIR